MPWVAAGVYLALVIVVMSTSTAPEGSAAHVLFIASFVLPWLGGTAHALAVRRAVFGRSHFHDAIVAAERHREIRGEARQVARDASPAWELSALAQLPPGLTPRLDEFAIFLP